MALDNRHILATHALPTQMETSYEPCLGASRRSSHHGSTPPFTNSPRASFLLEHDSYFPRIHSDKDQSHTEKRSSIDPRRFTSDLDNSLIQQIHSLRLDLENKNTVVGSLEESLQQSKAENEQLGQDLSLQATETRSLRKQMQLLENGTLTALGDMAKERDNAFETTADTRKRLETANKRNRLQEEDAEKFHAFREKEQQDWLNERRILEQKVHVMESRLKKMVAEMAAVEATGLGWPAVTEDGDEGARDARAIADAYSLRSDSRAGSRISTRSDDGIYDRKDPHVRAPSRLSALHEMGESKTTSLAEELEGGEVEDEEDQGYIGDAPGSPEALPEEQISRRKRYSEDQKARKMMGLPLEYIEDKLSSQHSMGIIMDYMNISTGRNSLIQYSDCATQCSPPSSPKLAAQRPLSLMSRQGEQLENTANQRRKRIDIPSMFLEQSSTSQAPAPKAPFMVCTGCQTDDLSPPSTAPETVIVMPEPPCVPPMLDSSAQTIEDDVSSRLPASSRLIPPSTDVPVIAIHPPSSRPPSAHTSVVLPPRTKNAGCQAALDTPKILRSISIQTDDIKAYKPPIRLPPRLPPSHVSAQVSSRYSEKRKPSGSASRPRIPRRGIRSPPPIFRDDPPPASPPIDSIKIAYPGKNDDGPLNDKHLSGPRRPIRSDSIFAGFSDEEDGLVDKIGDEYSDEDVVPIRKTLSKVKNSWKLVPQQTDSVPDRLEPASDEGEPQAQAGASKTITKGATSAPVTISKTVHSRDAVSSSSKLVATKQQDIRRAALVSSSSIAHAQRQRSPSALSAPLPGPMQVVPPFPVPTRSSSRKIPISASDGAGSPTPRSTSFFTTRRQQGRPLIKRKILRKVQSAAAVTKQPAPSKPPPPPMNLSSNPPSTPRSPLQPRNQFILPYPSESEQKQHSSGALPPKAHAGEASIETSNRQTSVVDAIAQTMVGEWMWKYVRKRTSFGITETPQTEFELGKSGEGGSTSGTRHKRWVWLAPYERAVIWSSKQPTSGPALLGKGGRKLAIQSVLDVKDDTPLPKGSVNEPIFDRSILILTPERALKFTATSKERHYIWLTALSFLSASSQEVTDLASPSPEQPPQFPRPPSEEPVVNYRRTPIRDSIRVSKAKSRPSMGPHSFSSPTFEMEFTHVPPTIPFEDIECEGAAEPPPIPRVASQARKRSGTGPRPAPLSAFHSYPSNPVAIGSSLDLHPPTARDRLEKNRPYSRSASGPATTKSTMTAATSASSIVPNNFFDAVGTVRMEAFVDNRKENRREEKRREKEAKSHRTRQGKKKDLSYWGVAGTAGGDVAWKKDDPFRGF